MNFIRKIINSDDLDSILTIPEELKHRKVEILVLPVEDKNENPDNFNPDEFVGILNLSTDDAIKEIKDIRNDWDRF